MSEVVQNPSKFDAPFNFTTVKEIHQGTNGKLLIHIQDAHANYSGQMSMAKALDQMMTTYGQYLVLAEGASKDVTLTELKPLADDSTWKIAARRFLQDSVIAGEEYLNLTSKHPMKIRGVEYQELYDKALETYASLVDKRKEILTYLHKIHVSMERLKAKHYSEALLDYEKKTKGPAGETADLTVQFDELMKLVGPAQIDLSKFPEVSKLKALKDTEKTISFDRANLEQEKLLSELSSKGQKAKVDEFIQSSKKTKNQQVSQSVLLSRLFDLADTQSIQPSSFPELSRYREYLKSFSDLDLEAVLKEVEFLEDHVYKNLLPAEDGRKLRAVDRFVGLLDKAYRIKMSSSDFKMLVANKDDFKTTSWEAFLNDQLIKLTYFDDLVPFKPYFEEAAEPLFNFYKLVDERDQAFLENTDRILKEEQVSMGYLIAGGYHTENLMRLFKDAGYSIVVLTPVVEFETDQTLYEKMLLLPFMLAKKEKEKRSRQLAKDSGKSISMTTLKQLALVENTESAPARMAGYKQIANLNVPELARAAARLAGKEASRIAPADTASRMAVMPTDPMSRAKEYVTTLNDMEKKAFSDAVGRMDLLANSGSVTPMMALLALSIIFEKRQLSEEQNIAASTILNAYLSKNGVDLSEWINQGGVSGLLSGVAANRAPINPDDLRKGLQEFAADMKSALLRVPEEWGQTPGGITEGSTVKLYAEYAPTDRAGQEGRDTLRLFEIHNIHLNERAMETLLKRIDNPDFGLFLVSEKDIRNWKTTQVPIFVRDGNGARTQVQASIANNAMPLLPDAQSSVEEVKTRITTDKVRISSAGLAAIAIDIGGQTFYVLALNKDARTTNKYKLAPLGGGIGDLSPEALRALSRLGVEGDSFEGVQKAKKKAHDAAIKAERTLTEDELRIIGEKAEKDLRFTISTDKLDDYIAWFRTRADRETDVLRELGEELVDEQKIMNWLEWTWLSGQFAFDKMKDEKEIVTAITQTLRDNGLGEADAGYVQAAYEFARAKHEVASNWTRDDGRNYIWHLLEIAFFAVVGMGITDKATILAILFHDMIEDTDGDAQSLRDFLTGIGATDQEIENTIVIIQLLTENETYNAPNAVWAERDASDVLNGPVYNFSPEERAQITHQNKLAMKLEHLHRVNQSSSEIKDRVVLIKVIDRLQNLLTNENSKDKKRDMRRLEMKAWINFLALNRQTIGDNLFNQINRALNHEQQRLNMNLDSVATRLSPQAPRMAALPIQKDVAQELLAALELADIDPAVRRMDVPKKSNMKFPRNGREALRFWLADVDGFELLRNERGQIIAIFPEVAKSTAPVKYLDLSDFYFDAPQEFGANQASIQARWNEFLDRRAGDKAAIAQHLQAEYSRISISSLSTAAPYVHAVVRFDAKTKEPSISVEPIDLDTRNQGERYYKSIPGSEQIVFPVFPTVFSPAGVGRGGLVHFSADATFYKGIFKYLKGAWKAASRVEVSFSGTGFDTWLAYLAAKSVRGNTDDIVWTVIDKNPFAAANSRAFFKLARIPAAVSSGDASLSVEKIDIGLANMPYDEGKSIRKLGTDKDPSQIWDRVDHEVFTAYMESLAKRLNEGGHAFVWNRTGLADEMETLAKDVGVDIEVTQYLDPNKMYAHYLISKEKGANIRSDVPSAKTSATATGSARMANTISKKWSVEPRSFVARMQEWGNQKFNKSASVLEPIDAPSSQTVTVLQGEYTIASYKEGAIKFIQTFGLGPCVAVGLWDSNTRTGVMTHIDSLTRIPDSFDTIIKKIEEKGIDANNTSAFIVGGDSTTPPLGLNYIKARLHLIGSKIEYEETGYDEAQSVSLDLETGKIYKIGDARKISISKARMQETVLSVLKQIDAYRSGLGIEANQLKLLEPISDQERSGSAPRMAHPFKAQEIIKQANRLLNRANQSLDPGSARMALREDRPASMPTIANLSNVDKDWLFEGIQDVRSAMGRPTLQIALLASAFNKVSDRRWADDMAVYLATKLADRKAADFMGAAELGEIDSFEKLKTRVNIATAQTMNIDGFNTALNEFVDELEKTVNAARMAVEAFLNGGYQERLLRERQLHGGTINRFVGEFTQRMDHENLRAAAESIAAIHPTIDAETIFEIFNLINTEDIMKKYSATTGVEAIRGIALLIKEELEAGKLRSTAFQNPGILPSFRVRVIRADSFNPLGQMIDKSRNTPIGSRMAELKNEIIQSEVLQLVKGTALEKEVNIETVEDLIKALNDRSQGVKTMREFALKDALKVRGGYSLGLSTGYNIYMSLSRILGIADWIIGYKENGIGATEKGHTGKYFDQITSSGKPVVFFVPSQLVTYPSGMVTREEMVWMLNHPDRLKNVHFVFGAYDYVPKELLLPIFSDNGRMEFIRNWMIDTLGKSMPGGQDASAVSAAIQNNIRDYAQREVQANQTARAAADIRGADSSEEGVKATVRILNLVKEIEEIKKNIFANGFIASPSVVSMESTSFHPNEEVLTNYLSISDVQKMFVGDTRLFFQGKRIDGQAVDGIVSSFDMTSSTIGIVRADGVREEIGLNELKYDIDQNRRPLTSTRIVKLPSSGDYEESWMAQEAHKALELEREMKLQKEKQQKTFKIAIAGKVREISDLLGSSGIDLGGSFEGLSVDEYEIFEYRLSQLPIFNRLNIEEYPRVPFERGVRMAAKSDDDDPLIILGQGDEVRTLRDLQSMIARQQKMVAVPIGSLPEQFVSFLQGTEITSPGHPARSAFEHAKDIADVLVLTPPLTRAIDGKIEQLASLHAQTHPSLPGKRVVFLSAFRLFDQVTGQFVRGGSQGAATNIISMPISEIDLMHNMAESLGRIEARDRVGVIRNRTGMSEADASMWIEKFALTTHLEYLTSIKNFLSTKRINTNIDHLNSYVGSYQSEVKEKIQNTNAALNLDRSDLGFESFLKLEEDSAPRMAEGLSLSKRFGVALALAAAMATIGSEAVAVSAPYAGEYKSRREFEAKARGFEEPAAQAQSAATKQLLDGTGQPWQSSPVVASEDMADRMTEQAAQSLNGLIQRVQSLNVTISYQDVLAKPFGNVWDTANASFNHDDEKIHVAVNTFTGNPVLPANSNSYHVFFVDADQFGSDQIQVMPGYTVIPVKQASDGSVFNPTLLNMLAVNYAEAGKLEKTADAMRFGDRLIVRLAYGRMPTHQALMYMSVFPGREAVPVLVQYSIPAGMTVEAALKQAELFAQTIVWAA